MKKRLLFLSGLLLAGNVYAGFYATTVHSRANCINNESITWWFMHYYDWRVWSSHVNIYGYEHKLDTGFSNTWRSAAVHWNEAPLSQSAWVVSGYHFLLSYGQGKIPFDSTTVGDCSIYNGWWDV